MLYQLSWYQEGRNAQSTLTGAISIAEMEAYNQELIDGYLNVGYAPIHIIADTREMRQFPTNLVKMNTLTSSGCAIPSWVGRSWLATATRCSTACLNSRGKIHAHDSSRSRSASSRAASS